MDPIEPKTEADPTSLPEPAPEKLTPKQPWERLDDEPNRWFQRFERFRLLGPTRSIEALYRAEREAKGREVKRPSHRWYISSDLYRWKERAEAWDKHLSDLAAAEVEAKWLAKVMEKTEVLARLSEMARGDVGDFMDIESMSYNLSMKKAKELGLTHLIKKVKQRTVITQDKDGEEKEEDIQEIELYSAHDALVDLGKHLKLFTENLDLTSGGKPLDDVIRVIVHGDGA